MRARLTGVFLLFCILGLSLASSILASRYPSQSQTDSAAGPAPPPGMVTLVAVGDTIVHSPMLTAAWDAQRKCYDYRPMFRNIKPDLEWADMTVAVLETVLGAGIAPYSGYPRFNSPDAVAEALQWAGVDLLFTAHNHMLDHGVKALFRTVDVLDGMEIAHVGSTKTAEPSARVTVLEANGIKVGFLSYTTITNGFPVPSSMPWSANLYSQKAMADDVARARAAGADFVAAALHAGVEYERQPHASQRKIVDEMVAAGVDIVLGSHPHAVQPIEIRRIKTPKGGWKDVFIAYSLGNFISNQIWRYSDCGLIVWLTLTKMPGEAPRLAGVHWHAVWVHRFRSSLGYSQYRVLPVDERGAAAYADDTMLTPADRVRIQQVWEETRELIGPINGTSLPAADGGLNAGW